jgi:hypothetical protein
LIKELVEKTEFLERQFEAISETFDAIFVESTALPDVNKAYCEQFLKN